MTMMKIRAKRAVRAEARRARKSEREEYAREQREKPADWASDDELWLERMLSEYANMSDVEQESTLAYLKTRADLTRRSAAPTAYIGYTEYRTRPIVYRAALLHDRVQRWLCGLALVSGVITIADLTVAICVHLLYSASVWHLIAPWVFDAVAVLALTTCVACALTVHHDRFRWRWLAKAKQEQERYNRFYEAALARRRS